MKIRSKARLHIAQCIEYPIDGFGGTEVLVSQLLKELHRHFDLTLVSPDEGLAGSPVRDFVVGHIPWRPPKATQASSIELARRLKAAGVEVVHFHGGSFAWGNRRLGVSPIWYTARLGLRTLTTNHGFFSPFEGYCAHYRPLWMKLALFFPAWLAKLQSVYAAEREITVSDYDLRQLQSWYWPQRAKFQRIYHSQLSEGEPRGGKDYRVKRIVCVGTFGYRKGQQYLAEAFREIAGRFPEWELLLAGRDPEGMLSKEIQESADSAGLDSRSRRVEGLSHAEIAELMASSEIFVMPSLFEGLGLSLQEALFHGCACVATRSGGPEDLIDDEENGLLVPKADASALSRALVRLMSDEALRRRFRERGPLSILQKKMTQESMLANYRELYES